MYVYKENNQSDGSLETVMSRAVVRGYLQDKEIIGDTSAPKTPLSHLKYFSEDAAIKNTLIDFS